MAMDGPSSADQPTQPFMLKGAPPGDSQDQGLFASTHWSAVLEAGMESSPHAAEALQELCQTYWRPVYVFVRRQGYSAADAEDLTQGFFEQLLRRNTIGRADPARGRFRSFLLVCLKNHLASTARHEHAQRRNPGAELLPLTTDLEVILAQDSARNLDPDVAYARQWAATLLQSVIQALAAEASREGWGDLFVHLHSLVCRDEGAVAYRELATRTGLDEGALRTRVSRLRHRYRDRLREAIGRTVDRPEDIDDEIRYLMNALG